MGCRGHETGNRDSRLENIDRNDGVNIWRVDAVPILCVTMLANTAVVNAVIQGARTRIR